MGVIVSFMYFNLFGDPKKNRKIFMGDSGSLTLGFILGFLAVKYAMDNPNVKFWRSDCLLLSYTFLIVPAFDVVRVSILRMWHRTPIFVADKNHIHHKLMRAGLTQHQTLVCVLLFSLFYIGLNAVLNLITSMNVIVLVDVLIWMMFHCVLNNSIRRRGAIVFLKNGEV